MYTVSIKGHKSVYHFQHFLLFGAARVYINHIQQPYDLEVLFHFARTEPFPQRRCNKPKV